MSKSEILNYTRNLFGNSSGDFYSWKNKNKCSNTTILKKSNISIGFTKKQLNKIIAAANGKRISFIIGDNTYYYSNETRFDDELIFFYESSYESTYIYPLQMISYIRIYDK